MNKDRNKEGKILKFPTKSVDRPSEGNIEDFLLFLEHRQTVRRRLLAAYILGAVLVAGVLAWRYL
jgi:hypothetical protein